ncbi:Angiotensin-converting enzyme [Gryllus bimaculatus]|nr:Angiotensin-converting enzyme [Gryllus bimaculatus]
MVVGSSRDAAEAGRFLRELEREGSASCFRANAARWAFSTNATDANRRRKLEQEALHAKFQRLSRRRAAAFARHALPDPAARRQLALLMLDGRLALPDAQKKKKEEEEEEEEGKNGACPQLQQLLTEMKEVYAHAEICPYATRQQLFCTLAMDPDVARALAASRDWDEQLHLWRAWRDAVGPPLRQRFLRHLELTNDAARLNGFADAGEQARAAYEVPGDALPDALAETWAALSPLYRQLHAYVRRRLLEHYGPQRLRADGPLPAHVFGNMWAQNWRHLYPLVQPYPRRHTLDVTGEMLRQGFTPLRSQAINTPGNRKY